MTHSLHRRGTKENLSRDYVLLCLPAMGHNDKDHDPKLQEFLKICMKHNPLNMGAIQLGNMYSHKAEEVIKAAHGIVHAVYDNPGTVTNVLKDLKKADIGMSIVVSGIFENVDQALAAAGLKHHTANFSLGIWGKTEKLASNEILEITTMCGHALIPSSLVKMLINEVKAGRKTAEAAGKQLAPNCACGIFNPARAGELIAAAAKK